MSSSGWRRPQGAARQAQRHLRNAFSSLDIHQTEDSGSDSSEAHIRPRALHTAKSFPPPASAGDADDEFPSFSGSGPSSSDAMTGQDNTGTDMSTARGISNQENNSQPIHNGETAQDASALPREWDAQSCYPPEACVFVANQHYDDLTIASAVTKVFNKYGTVFVKIKRDKRQMPFGFAQYTKGADAELALANLRGVEILGRPVRTERCNANLVFLVIRRNGGRVSHQEARSLLAPFGAIAKVEDLDPATQERLNLAPAVRVRFEMFDPRRDVVKGVGDNTPFVIINFDFKVAQDASERDPTDTTFMEMYEKDRRSIFIGSLPSHATDLFVRELAKAGGTVVNVRMRQSVDSSTGTSTYYAFVEFDRPDAPDKAISCLNGMRIGDTALRVERRRTKPAAAAQTAPMAPYGTVPPVRPHRRNASTFVTPRNEPAQARRARGHYRSASAYNEVLAGPQTVDFSMGAWPPKGESPYEPPQSQPKTPYEPPQSQLKTQPSSYRQPSSRRQSASRRESSTYQPSYIELQSGQSPYQHTSYRKPTYLGSEYQQMQYERLQEEQQYQLHASPRHQAQSTEILQPEPLRIPARKLFALDEATAMGPPAMPADAPLVSPNKLRPSVHFAPSPAVSSATSSDLERNRNPYLSHAHRASTLGPSFCQRIAGHRSGHRRSVTNLFPSVDDAATRAKSTLDESHDAQIQRTLAKYIQRANEENMDKAAEDAAKKASEEATLKAFQTAADLAMETAAANEEAA
ncbi:hypothetical protein N0V84_011879 [Fusarium piperis]|uniref:RRM domain-containing protein n=1 Tax=Fusarium piperis TaxID=1435070 RepID=A0A9W8TB49_9HYPO|nr:hypothetical protein N0V84_011879 [Fusarium piperis]